jgi:NADH-quinone oxidoreductase subunit G
MEKLGSPNIDCRQDGAKLDPSLGRAAYIFNATIAGIEQADALLIIGSNPRREAPVLNARIRKRWRVGNFPVGLIGEAVDLTYGHKYLGAGAESLADVTSGKGFGEDFAKAARPLVIVGQGALARSDGAAILALAAKAAGNKDGWSGLCVLHTAAARVGGLDLDFVPQAGGKDVAAMAEAGALDVLFNLGADEIDIAPGAFVIYQGTHGDRGAHRADVILPGAAYTEKSGTYVNTEGRVQIADRACFPPGDAREDWAILRALSDVLGVRLSFDSLAQLRRAVYGRHPHFSRVDQIERSGDLASLAASAGQGASDKTGFVAAVQDFYLTNPIARASAVMAECSALALDRQMRQAAE